MLKNKSIKNYYNYKSVLVDNIKYITCNTNNIKQIKVKMQELCMQFNLSCNSLSSCQVVITKTFFYVSLMVTKKKTPTEDTQKKIRMKSKYITTKINENKRREEKQKAIIDAKQLRNLKYSLSVITLKVND